MIGIPKIMRLPWRLCSEVEYEKAAKGGCETLEAQMADGTTCRAAQTWDMVLISQIFCHSSFGVSGPPMVAIPAFEQKRSIGPISASVVSIRPRARISSMSFW